MTIDAVRQWLEPLIDSGTLSVGKSPDAEKCVMLYDASGESDPVLAFGGVECTGYNVLPCKLLLRWGTNLPEAHARASTIFETILSMGFVEIDGVKAFLQFTCQAPIPIDTDKHGRYEYVLTFKIIHER